MTQLTRRNLHHISGIELDDELRRLVTEAKSADPLRRVTVVTPSYFSSFYLRRWLASTGLLNVEFMRIEDIADMLAREADDLPIGRAIGRIEGSELIRSAVSACIASAKITGSLAGLAMQPSFLSAMQRTLRDIEAEQPPDGFQGGFKIEQSADTNEVARAISATWSEYRRLKESHGLVDRTEVAARAANALESGALTAAPLALSIGHVVVLAASMPAPQYRRLWQKLMSLDEVDALLIQTGYQEADAELAAAFDVSPAPIDSTPAQPSPPEAVSASDTRSEMAALAGRIAEQAEAGSPLSRIAVLCGTSDYAERVRSALKAADIPVCGPPQESLLGAPAGRLVQGLLKIATSGLERKSVGDWLATCPVRNPLSGQPVPGIEWDRISRTAKVTGGPVNWQRQLDRFAASSRRMAERARRYGDDSEDGGGERAAISLERRADSATDLAAFAARLASDLEQSVERQSWSEWAAWLRALIDSYSALGSPGDDSQEAGQLFTVLERIGGLDTTAGTMPDLAHFSATVIRELGSSRSGGSALGRGVFIALVRDAAATRFDHAHVVGMSDGSFPSPDAADPLLPDSLRNHLNERYGIGLQVAADRKHQTRVRFLAALQSASSATLYWSRASGPGTGQAGPSLWLIEQLRRWPKNAMLQAGSILERPHEVEGLCTAEFAAAEHYADIHEYDIASVRRTVNGSRQHASHWLESDEESGVPGALALENSRYRQPITEWSGDLSSIAADVPAFGGEPLSASRVETFASCPLKYLFTYLLDVDPGVSEESSFHMAPDVKGTFVHEILERYLNLRTGEQQLPQGEETLNEAFQQVTERWKRDDSVTTGRVWEIESAEILRQLRLWIIQEKRLEEQGYGPLDAELSFGRPRGVSPDQLDPVVEYTLDDGTVLTFSGKIDRVDGHPEGHFLVMDYKSGKPDYYKGIKKDPVDRGRHLQLPLYSYAVRELRSPSGSVSAGFWFVLDRGQTITPEPGEYDADGAEQRLNEVLETLHDINSSGMFPPNPGNGSPPENCKYCDFESVCPTEARRKSMLEIQSKDPRLSGYFDMAMPGENGGEE